MSLLRCYLFIFFFFLIELLWNSIACVFSSVVLFVFNFFIFIFVFVNFNKHCWVKLEVSLVNIFYFLFVIFCRFFCFVLFHEEVLAHHNHLRTFIKQYIGTGRDKMMIRQWITYTVRRIQKNYNNCCLSNKKYYLQVIVKFMPFLWDWMLTNGHIMTTSSWAWNDEFKKRSWNFSLH